MYQPNLKSVPEITAIAVVGGVPNLESWGRGGLMGSGWYRSKERWLVPIYPP